ncbi:hypothetical protein D9758_011640 [Tetrapyrgos nigripes]|uniref:RlpA-like protein double-psi beta-barrel domain-containing protein n=1 Tax=Tetrapyrgos nigripes TaxID=182062 RepID=A0A8H5CSA4_9AGAR|nr:hypothetical protein D9758_011640 [Tetrapyrgos nigripes]
MFAKLFQLTAATVAAVLAMSITTQAAPAASRALVRRNVGDGTLYNPALGACGISNTDADMVAAVSASFFDTFPGATANPNLNPLCNKPISASFNGKTITVTIVDRCTQCVGQDLDFSPTAFSQLADPAIGRINGVTWDFI